MAFQDHFSNSAHQYAQYRPSYPDELYERILKEVRKRGLAWDAATGSGQAAVALAKHFRKVIATDPSEEQIANAIQIENIEYRVETAEAPTLDNKIADLVTVAVGAHWLDLEAFEKAVERVAAPGCVLAIWAYYLPKVDNVPQKPIDDFYSKSLEGYWPAERKHIDEWYRNINFAFPKITEETLTMSADWTLDQLCGFFSSWSAVNRKIQDTGEDPVREVRRDLEQHWSNSSEAKHIEWPLFLKMWRVKG